MIYRDDVEFEPHSIEECRNEEEWKKFMGNPTIRKGDWEGAGHYAKFCYAQPCPRGCCSDDVTELVPLTEYMGKLKGHIKEQIDSLRHYRSLNKKYDLIAKYEG